MSTSKPAAADRAQPPVGIDLGTTYSLLAYVDSTGRPVTMPNAWGDLLTPSAVLVDEEEIVVGKQAVKNAVLSPERYAECFKRDMGRPQFRRKVCDVAVPPEVLSAFVLERLRQDAATRLGPIERAVITVPAFFDETRRRATQEAGRLAGLEVLDIINEPTAAAVAHGYGSGFLKARSRRAAAAPHCVLVYDLGGGTFDVTILQIEGHRFRALATDGDVRLGGTDFDERLVQHLAQKFLDAHGADPRSDPQDGRQLWMDAQEAKHALSERLRTTVVLFHAGIRMRVEVTREEFDKLTADLVGRTETTASLVVQEAGLDWSDIDRVLLVGGATRMPAVRQMLRRVTGKEPDSSQSPDEAVAHGAALYAGMLRAGTAADRPTCELINVNSHSLGVVGVQPITGEKQKVVLIPKNTPLPCRASKIFHTGRANQRTVCVPVVEGESERPEECVLLGECIVSDLPPGLPQGTDIEVEYQYAANGRISVAARVPRIRYVAHVEIQRDQRRKLEDLDFWRGRLLGRAAPASSTDAFLEAGTVDIHDRASVLRRLDELYARVGRVALEREVSQSPARSREAAAASAAEVVRTRARLREAERERQAAIGSAEAIRLDAALARARAESDQAQVQAKFACLALGRECVQANVVLVGAERELQEIRELRRHLET
jgi:molecular chaperone DnaK